MSQVSMIKNIQFGHCCTVTFLRPCSNVLYDEKYCFLLTIDLTATLYMYTLGYIAITVGCGYIAVKHSLMLL